MLELLEDKEGLGLLFSNVTVVSIQVTREVTVRNLKKILIETTARLDATIPINFAESRKVKEIKRQL